MICLDENLVARFIQGQLASAEAVQVEQHLDECASCTALLVFFGRAYNPMTGELVADDGPYRDAPSSARSIALPAVGTVLGRYVTLHRLGAGGMGVVFAAHDPTLHRKVAIKLMRPDPLGGETSAQGRSRMLREARAMAQLSHPNVVSVYDVGTLGDHVFIAMELVEGLSLSAWLSSTTRPMNELLRVLRDAGRGLAAAHAAGVVHRDFKPDNVLIGNDGRVRVSDFGLAGALADTSLAGPIHALATAPSSSLAGTPAYMSPEQLSSGVGDPRSDQWAYFVTVYEAVYRRRPFDGDDPAGLLASIISRSPDLPDRRDVPSWLQAAIARGLSPRAADRFPSMSAVLEALEADAARAAVAQVRVHAVLQSVMWVLHVSATLFVVSVMIRRALSEGYIAAPSDGTTALWEALAGVYGLLLLAWIPLGLLWIPVNVYGLLRRRSWARLSSMIYGWISLVTCVGTPYALFAVWGLSRPGVVEYFREGFSPAAAATDPATHVRTNVVLQYTLAALHAGMCVLLAVLAVDHAGHPPSAASAADSPVLPWEWWSLFALSWAIVGLPWTVVNALGLRRTRRWARYSAMLYAAVAVPTCLGTPFGLYALWSLSRKGVADVFAPLERTQH